MEYRIGDKYNGFILEKEEQIDDINSNAKIFKHEKTGAKLLHIGNDDTNKVFSIGFKTPPNDSTGVMHILEHSVLCGSRKFPTKEPFVELAKGSLNTFLNAMTYSDKTIYPIASQNEKDFFNLMDVYLDAVFYPKIYDTKEILMQEGWHYELGNKDENLKYKGVVYNEMKGAFSSPEGILMRKIQETLFPDNTYYNESGGDPKYIPDLTYEEFIDTHKKYYHPSNSYIYLYGDGDLNKMLKFIDGEYLSRFEKKHIDSDIKPQEKYSEMKKVEYSYSIAEEDEIQGKTYLGLNFVTGRSTDEDVYMGLSILEYLLLETEGAPLKKALLDYGIGNDVFGSFDNGILQPVFSIIAKGSEVNKAEEFRKVIIDKLNDIVKNGIDKKLIEGCMNVFEFKLRESDTGSYPKGLVYYMNAMDSWLYGGDPLMHIKYNNALDNIKKGISSNYFENLINKYLLNNTHSSLLILKPKKGLDIQENSEINNKLEEYKNSLTNEELENIINESKSLIKRQSTPDSEEVLSSIPMLSLDDIDKNVEDITLKKLIENDIDILFYESFTSDIAYLNFMFYSKCVEEKDIQYFSLLGNLLGKVDTEKYNYKELSNEILINTGDLYFKNQVYSNDKDINKYYPFFEVHTKIMNDKVETALDLISEIIVHSNFDDKKRVKEIIKELISRIEMALMQSGHQVAVERITSYFLPISAYSEKISGYDYYIFLKEIDSNFDNRYEEVKSKLIKIKELVFNKNNLTVAVTGTDKELKMLRSNLIKVTRNISSSKVETRKYAFNENNLNEGLMISSNVQYVAKGYNFNKLNYRYDGSMLVLKTILGYDYLWNRVRVKGGAYGAMASIGRNGNLVFVSYRDPNLVETLKAYDESVSYLDSFDISDREMTKYIIGTISNLDFPLSPLAKGQKAVALYIRGISHADLQKERDEVLSTNKAKIREFSKMVNDVMNKDIITVVGSDKVIKDNNIIFKNIISILN